MRNSKERAAAGAALLGFMGDAQASVVSRGIYEAALEAVADGVLLGVDDGLGVELGVEDAVALGVRLGVEDGVADGVALTVFEGVAMLLVAGLDRKSVV